jgi:GNAT superfamily N-acetyltransferase
MTRRLANATLDNLEDLPSRCRECVYWELDPVACERARDNGDTELEKEAWVSDTLLEWGSCGQLVYVDGVAAGYVLYAPAAYVPRSVAFPTSPVSPDAVLLMTARIVPEFRGGGLGRMLVQGVARDIVRRGVRAIEAFGRTGNGRPEGEDDVDYSCLLPADYLRAVGFKTVRPHPRTPRLRLDVKSTVTWKEDMESAIERLLSSLQAPVPSR